MEMCVNKFRNIILTTAYVYLTIPVIIFFLGWCRWYIGIPMAFITVISVFLCKKEYKERMSDSYVMTIDYKKLVGIGIIILVWAGLSGVGGLVWQNSDHWWRNTIFDLLVNENWPVVKAVEIDGILEEKGMAYYIGYWLPAALFGKLFGLEVGYVMQYVWAVIGIFIFYMLICAWRKKTIIWPLIVFIFFSGLDYVGMQLGWPYAVELFGLDHIEAWSWKFQYSSITTQLFWVFNQAIPAWIASVVVFLWERPRNIIFIVSLIVLTSTFPFIGLLPFAVYFMVKRSKWRETNETVLQVVQNGWSNFGSIQNITGVLITLLSATYVLGNSVAEDLLAFFDNGQGAVVILAAVLVLVLLLLAGIKIALLGKGKWLAIAGTVLLGAYFIYSISTQSFAEWTSPLFFWIDLTVFYFLEVGVFLIYFYSIIRDKKLFWLNAVWLYVIPTIIIGESCDFCMRASIPGILMIVLWCIQSLEVGLKNKQPAVYVLLALLLVGAITPLHEIRRTYNNTVFEYENAAVEESAIMAGYNFSGSLEGFFWKNIAK